MRRLLWKLLWITGMDLIVRKRFIILIPQERLLEILEKLDAKQHTLVNLVLSEENYLMIGGGGGKYVVTGEENGIIFNLINPKAGSTLKIELNTGGQIGLFESKYILSKEIAFKCAVK